MVIRVPPPSLSTEDEEQSRVRNRGPLGASVLIIDDLADARELSAACLEIRGFRAMAAEDGPSGLAMAVAAAPDAILLDFSMPEMDGEEVIRRLKADDRTRHIPVVMLTAMPDAVSRSTRAAVAVFLEKPCETSALGDAIVQALAANGARLSLT